MIYIFLFIILKIKDYIEILNNYLVFTNDINVNDNLFILLII